VILLIAADWQFRALVRAQLLEEGYEVQAFPDLEVALFHLERSEARPQLALVDSQGLRIEPDAVSRVWQLIVAEGPLLLCAGLLDRGILDRAGMPPARLLVRPFSVGDVVAEVRRMGIWPQAGRTDT
jgi:DNA-binding response OmpR family regulator